MGRAAVHDCRHANPGFWAWFSLEVRFGFFHLSSMSQTAPPTVVLFTPGIHITDSDATSCTELIKTKENFLLGASLSGKEKKTAKISVLWHHRKEKWIAWERLLTKLCVINDHVKVYEVNTLTQTE